MNAITYAEYWAEVSSIAKSVTEEARKDDRDIGEALHETIDGHQWVIYTFHNFGVMQHSPNDGAWEDMHDATGPYPGDAVRAYCALHQDVSEHSEYAADDDDDETTEEVKP